jgi:hypothetical protein
MPETAIRACHFVQLFLEYSCDDIAHNNRMCDSKAAGMSDCHDDTLSLLPRVDLNFFFSASLDQDVTLPA